MAHLLNPEWSQDHPFDSRNRHLQKEGGERPTRSERREEREHAQANKRWERKTGETLDEAEARRAAEAAEQKEAEAAKQRELAEKMTSTVAEKMAEVGEMNVAELTRRIEAKRDSGELNEEQLTNLDEALLELGAIHAKRENKEISEDAYRDLMEAFTGSHLDLILTSTEVEQLRGMVDERLQAHEANLDRVKEAQKVRSVSEIEKLALAFVKEEGTEDHINVDANQLDAGSSYVVDFHDIDGTVNRYAHQNVTLGHILAGTGLRHVEVDKANGVSVDAYLWPDGKTYTNAPWEKDKGHYVGIVSGDKFTVLADSYAPAPKVDDGRDALAQAQQKEATAEARQFNVEVAHDDRITLEEAERVLDGSTKADIPADVARMKGADLEASLRAMDMGDYVIKICEKFAGMPGSIASKESGTSLFIDIMEHGNRRKMALNEVTKAVFGVNGEAFMKEYQTIKQEAETLRWLEFYMAQEKTADPTMTSETFFAKAKAAQGKDEDRNIMDKYAGEISEMFTKYEPGKTADSITRPAEVQRVMSTRSLHKEFILNTHRLLKAVPLIKAPDYVATGVDRSFPKSPELTNVAEPALSVIFPPNQGAPLTRAGLWKNLTRRVGDEANMGNMGERTKYDEAREYEKLFTSLYAYNEIRAKVTRIEDGQEVVDLPLLASTLEMYRQQGQILMQKDLQDQRRETGQRIMFADEPITVETLSNMKGLSQNTLELIQHGMMVEHMKEFAKLKEAVIQSYPEDVQQKLDALSSQYELTPQELQEIGDNIRVAQVTMLHFTHSEMRHLNAEGNLPEKSKGGRPVNPKEMNLGATQTFTIFDHGTNKITLSMGLNYNAQWDEVIPNSFEENFSIHLGPSYTKTVGKGERNHLTVSAGAAGPFPGKETWGAGGSLSYRHDWGEFKTWSSGLSLGVGAQIEPGTPFLESLALVHAGVTIVDINQSARVVKKASEAFAENKEYYKQQLSLLDAKFDEKLGTIDQLSPQQLKLVKAQLMDYFKQEIVFNTIDDMNTIQFDKIGIDVIAHPPYLLLRLGIAIKGKTQMVFIKPDHLDFDQLASDSVVQQAFAAGGEGVKVIDVSAKLLMNKDGERSYAREAFDPFSELDAANQSFMENQRVKIERTPNASEFRLLPLQVDGLVEVYPDANEGIMAYPGTNGEIYFSIPAGTDLAIHRHTHSMPLPDGGVQEVTRIYLTDNPSKSLDQISKSKTHHVEAYMSQRPGGRNSRATDKQHILAEEVVTNYEAEIMEGNYEQTMEAQAALDAALGAYEGRVGISRERFEAMKSVVEGANIKIDARLQDNNEAYSKALIEAARPLMAQLNINESNSAEMTALIQLVLIKDRSNAPTDPERFIKHIERWNQPSIERSLVNANVDPAMAGTMSRKISSFYAISMLEAIKRGDMKMPESPVELNTMVQTHIGRMPSGNVMEFMNGQQDSVQLEGAMVMDDALLAYNLKMTPEEIGELKRALSEQMAPVNYDNPDLLMQHPIALQILADGAVLLGPDNAKALAEISDLQSSAGLEGKQKEAYDAFVSLMKALATPGPGLKTAEFGGRTINIRVEMQIGFINKCRNFTTTYKAERIRATGGQAVRTTERVGAEAAVNFYGAEAAVGMSVQERQHERPERPEQEADEEAESDQEHSDDEESTMEEIYDGRDVTFPGGGFETGDEEDGF